MPILIAETTVAMRSPLYDLGYRLTLDRLGFNLMLFNREGGR